MTYFPYNHELARAVAARFIQLEGGVINKMKLMKLMYLLDREAICEDGCAIIGGCYMSFPYGPIVSEELDAANYNAWRGILKSDSGYYLQLNGGDYGFDLLSEWVEEKIQAVYNKFGKMTQFELSDYTHQKENCPEWKNPSPKKTEYISLRDIAGDKADEVEALAQELSMFAKR